MKESESRQITSEVLLSKILNTTSTCIFWKDAQRRFIGVNQAFLDYYGFASEKELLGRTDEDMGWHSDPDPFKNDEWRILKNGESTVRVHGTCMVRGRERDILASKSPLYEGGKIVGLVGTFEDVTSDYQQKDEIRKLTETLDHIPCGICIGQIRFGRIVCVSANGYFAGMVGGTPEDFVGKDVGQMSDWFCPDDVPQWNAAAAQLCADAKATEGIYRVKNRATGEYLWLRVKGCKARAANDEEFLYFTFTDESELKNAENRESALRELYASSIDAAELVVWEYDIAAHTVTFDKSGYTARRCGELGLPTVLFNVPECLYSLIPEEYHGEVKRLYDDVAAGKPYTACDAAFQPNPGQAQLFLRLSYTTILDSDGKPVKAYGTSQDKTREKAVKQQYEYELRFIHSDTQKRFIAKGHHDLTANRIISYCRSEYAALDVTGMTYDDAYRSLPAMIADEDDRDKYLELFNREHVIARFRSGESHFSMEYRRRGGINPAMWVRIEGRTYQNPNTGNIECFLYNYDITGQKIQQQLSYNLHSIGYESVGLISMPEAKVRYYQLAENGRDWVERSAALDYQENADQVILQGVPEKEQAQALEMCRLERVTRELEKTGDYSYSYGIFNRENNLRRKFLHFSFFNGVKNVIFLSIQDITEQYAKEQKQIGLLQEAIERRDEANRAKTDFLSRMSHDIRTPMNGIIGMTYLAKHQDNQKIVREYLDKIDISSKFLLGLVNDILDMSKIESGKIELHPEPYSAGQFLDYLNAVIKPLCEEKGQTFVLDAQPVLSVVPLLDELRINQIFFNLVSNAVKYTPEGGTITYRLREKLLENNRLQMVGDVIDTGIGMSEELLQTAFEPFAQGERSDTSSSRGTGLGLPIVKSLIELMGGTVSVTSELGKGSDFHLEACFDCIPAREAEQKNVVSDQVRDRAVLDGRRILLCEDHPLNQEIARTLLESWKMIVTVTENGATGVSQFKSSNAYYYDIVLMDVRMPVMDGIEATKAIRALPRPDAKTVSILAMTADAFSDDVQKCLSAGMNGHIAKPINPELLASELARYLRDTRHRFEIQQ